MREFLRPLVFALLVAAGLPLAARADLAPAQAPPVAAAPAQAPAVAETPVTVSTGCPCGGAGPCECGPSCTCKSPACSQSPPVAESTESARSTKDENEQPPVKSGEVPGHKGWFYTNDGNFCQKSSGWCRSADNGLFYHPGSPGAFYTWEAANAKFGGTNSGSCANGQCGPAVFQSEGDCSSGSCGVSSGESGSYGVLGFQKGPVRKLFGKLFKGKCCGG